MTQVLKILLLLLPGSATAAQVELLRCVSEVKSILSDQKSDLFFDNGFAFGAQSGVFLIANERSILAFRFSNKQSRSVRMLVPNSDPRRSAQMIFLTFLHSEVYGSRLVSFSMDQPPAGQSMINYQLVKSLAISELAKRKLLSQMIQDDLSEINNRFRRGEISRSEMLNGNLSLCRGIATTDLVMNHRLNQQIDELELVSSEFPRASRSPASLGF